MRKVIFISYGDEIYRDSRDRIKKMAEDTGVFDEIRIYTPDDLPDEVKNHELMQYSRGGGYWFWKPYIILKTLQEMAGEDDIVVYSDAGSEVFGDPLWYKYFDMLKEHGAILFKFWGLMKHWTRRNLLDHYKDTCNRLGEMRQCHGALSLWTRKALPVVQEWYDIMRDHPEYVIDATELDKEDKVFQENRHDQSVIACIAYKYEKEYKLKILWEHSEVYHAKGQIAFFSRNANTPERLNGRPHITKTILGSSMLWRMRHKMINIVRDIRQFIYRRIL